MNANEGSKVEYESLNFESLKYSLLDDNDDILLDSSCDPDLNFFKNNIRNLDTNICFQTSSTIFWLTLRLIGFRFST